MLYKTAVRLKQFRW